MAIETNCIFCGKEIVKGFFKGESKRITFGAAPALICCEDCFSKYDRGIENCRFGTKYETLVKHSKKKYTEKEEAELYLRYIEEERQQLEKCGGEVPEIFLGFAGYNTKGYFTVREFGQGFLNQDVGAKAMVKSLKKAKQDTWCCCFDKNDITKLEYYQDGGSEVLNLTSQAFSFGIRLNDESVMTYKPCITRMAVIGKGLFFGYKKSAEKEIIKQLQFFKEQIGSDLPIIKGKK